MPTEESVRLALRTQQIIAFESGVTNTVDPLGGSYYVENLTNEIENAVWEYLGKIEAMGGSVNAIEAGYFQNEIGESAYKYQHAIETKEKIMVGVNEFVADEDRKVKIFEVDPKVRDEQIERLKRLRQKRDKRKAVDCLEALKQAAVSSNNVMPAIVYAVENYATIGEISDVLRESWGIYE